MADINQPSFWERIYRQGGAGWDLGRPTPVFKRLLEEGFCVQGKMIVLGAGRGYDARMFARRGYQVTAVDFADEAAQAMRALADPEAPVEILQSDFFKLPREMKNSFDYVLDYTCFCAIDPIRRAEYADLVTCLLKPGGTYIVLAFPISDHRGGPPFAVSPDQLLDLFLGRGFEILRREEPKDSVPSRSGAEELLILRKRETGLQSSWPGE
jgi:SAM-dependent methyltransferase